MPNPDLAAALNDLGARIKRQQVSPTTRDPYLVASFERVQAAVVAKCNELIAATNRIEELLSEPTPTRQVPEVRLSDAPITRV